MRPSKVDFVRLQGFTTEGCQDGLYSALMFQPRVIAGRGDLGRRLSEPLALPGAVNGVVVERPGSRPQPVRRILQPRDGGPDAARRHACGAPAEAILAGHGRDVCHEHRHDALRRSVARGLAARGRVRRRVDECRRPPILPSSLRVLSAVASNSRDALSVAVGARVNLDPRHRETIRGDVDGAEGVSAVSGEPMPRGFLPPPVRARRRGLSVLRSRRRAASRRRSPLSVP